MPYSFTCLQCGKEFTAKYKTRQFCSHACALDNINTSKAKPITAPCPHCGKLFTFFAYRQKKMDRIYCSYRCSRANQERPFTQVTVQCEMCGRLKEIKPYAVKRFRFCSKECTRAYVLENMPRISSIEIKMAKAFKEANMMPETQYLIGPFTADFAFPDYRLAVECDGEYWHRLPDVQKRDKMKNHYLHEQGWHILRLWEHEINSSPLECVKRVQSRLQQLISSPAQI